MKQHRSLHRRVCRKRNDQRRSSHTNLAGPANRPRSERVLKKLVEHAISNTAAGQDMAYNFRSFQITEIIVLMRLAGERGWRLALWAGPDGVSMRFVPINREPAEK